LCLSPTPPNIGNKHASNQLICDPPIAVAPNEEDEKVEEDESTIKKASLQAKAH
jgi:hypothetical protein